MNSLENAYVVDEVAAREGKWFTTEAGVRLKIAKMEGNEEYKKEVVRLQRPHLAVLRSSANTDDLLDKITEEAMAKTILLDWEIYDENKALVPYTWESGVEAFERYPDFKADVSSISVARDNFRPEEVAEK